MRKTTIIITILILISLIAGAVYYWMFFKDTQKPIKDVIEVPSRDGFMPLNTKGVIPSSNSTSTNNIDNSNSTKGNSNNDDSFVELPKLRQLSEFPVAGMFASTTKIKKSITATTSTTYEITTIRFIDRGTGHVYEANDVTSDIDKISNTTLPKIYEAYWNKNLTATVLRYLKDNNDSISNLYAEIKKTPSNIASSTTPYEIKGKYLSNFDQVSVSPAGDKIFTWNIENGRGVGYVSAFDEKTRTKVVDTPMNQVNIDWPELSTLTVVTKGLSSMSGYMYSINTKNAEMRRVIGDIRGLTARMSNDGKQVIYSTGGSSIETKLLNTQKGTSGDVIFKTLADKCVWSKIRKNEVYCAVPTEIPSGSYPEDWYKGSVSFTDQIWILNTTNGEVHLLANPLNLNKVLVDAINLTLDPKENYLYFINKRDLTLWSLDLAK